MILPIQILNITKAVSRGTRVLQAIADEEISPLEFFKHLDTNPQDKLLFDRSRQIALEMVLDESEGVIERAGDRFELEKAKAIVAHRSWMAEKLISQTYGNKVTHNINETINITHILAEANNRVATINAPITIESKAVSVVKDELSDEEKELLG